MFNKNEFDIKDFANMLNRLDHHTEVTTSDDKAFAVRRKGYVIDPSTITENHYCYPKQNGVGEEATAVIRLFDAYDEIPDAEKPDLRLFQVGSVDEAFLDAVSFSELTFQEHPGEYAAIKPQRTNDEGFGYGVCDIVSLKTGQVIMNVSVDVEKVLMRPNDQPFRREDLTTSLVTRDRDLDMDR